MRAENERARSSEALDAARAEVLRLGEVLGPADLQAHAKEPRRRAHAALDHGLKRRAAEEAFVRQPWRLLCATLLGQLPPARSSLAL